MKKSRQFIILLFTFCAYLSAGAQSTCNDALYEADKLFENGKIRECIDRLEPCVKSQKDKEERIESYHLLAMAYQVLNDAGKTNYYVKKLLQLKPDYQKFPNIDPIDFSRVVNQYKVYPKLFIGLKAGGNITFISLIRSYSVFSTKQYYNPQAGAQLGFTFNYILANSLHLNADLLFNRYSVNHIIDTAGSVNQKYKEQQNYYSLNILLVKDFRLKKNIEFFTGLGFGLAWLYKANIYFQSINLETGADQQASKNPTSERFRLQPGIDLSAGLNYRTAQGILSLEIRFAYFLRNTVDGMKRFDDTNFIFNNQYVNDDIRLRPLIFNMSYALPVKWKIELNK